MKRLLPALLCVAAVTTASAQLSENPDKFLGNITTRYAMDAGGGVPQYYKLWNQVTCENESKWSSVEGNRGTYNWGGSDKAFNYAKNHKFTYKFHALVWGAQYPGWLSSLVPNDRYASYVKWFDAVKKKYNHLPMIDVVNEAVGTHQPGNPMVKESLGGGGKTGFDWLIKAFEMAYERFPNSILIYNDYNSIRWDLDNYITLVQTLRDAGAPIDAYGNQSHELSDISQSELKSALKKQQDALKMPMFVTELDIDIADDNRQKSQYQSVLPVMWEAEYCAGVTLWGYVHGATWVDNSGLYKGGTERPAMTWLKEYMATDKAKQAKSPYPGMKKRVGVYVRPRDLKVSKGDVLPILVRTHITDDARAEKSDIAIEKVELYVGTELVSTMTEEPYLTEYAVPSSASAGWKTMRAVVTTNDGNTYERYGRFNVLSGTTKRRPYADTVAELPGTIEAENYDYGASGVAYYNYGRNNPVTKDGGWAEYTVDVKEDGLYSFDAVVASAKAGGVFHIAEYRLDGLDYLTEFVNVPATGGTTEFKTLHGRLLMPLTAGRHIFCVMVDKGGFYFDKIAFSRYEENAALTVAATMKPTTITVGETTTISVTARANTGNTLASVSAYANNLYLGTLTEAPYTFDFVPQTAGTYTITAIATDVNGKEKMSTKKTLKVNGKREPYKSAITVPGVIQAENFDKGGEGMTFHDSDSKNEGDASYRTDNEGLDLVKGNGGTAIGYTANGEWTEYTVNVKQAGEYSYTATISNGSSSTGGFTISLVKGSTVTQLAKVSFAGTGGWDTYKTVKGTLSKNLDAGEQIIRFTINPGNCNIDKVELKCTAPVAAINTVSADEAVEDRAYNLSGQRVGGDYRGIVVRNGRKVLRR